jgi:hypothetical protein
MLTYEIGTTILSVDVRSRWDALELMRALARHRVWMVQMGPSFWVVSARIDGDAAEALATVRRWSAQRNVERVTGRLGGDDFVLSAGEAVA